MSNNLEQESALDTPVEATVASSNLPPRLPDPNQGHTVAAWTAVLILIVAALLVALGLVFGEHWLAWTGLGLAVLGVISGKVLQMAGFGQKPVREAATE